MTLLISHTSRVQSLTETASVQHADGHDPSGKEKRSHRDPDAAGRLLFFRRTFALCRHKEHPARHQKSRGNGGGEKAEKQEQEEAVRPAPGGDCREKLHIARAGQTKAEERIEPSGDREKTDQERRPQEKPSGEQRRKDQMIRDPAGYGVTQCGSSKENEKYRNGKIRRKHVISTKVNVLNKQWKGYNIK